MLKACPGLNPETQPTSAIRKKNENVNFFLGLRTVTVSPFHNLAIPMTKSNHTIDWFTTRWCKTPFAWRSRLILLSQRVSSTK
jgi:hypothetical protein